MGQENSCRAIPLPVLKRFTICCTSALLSGTYGSRLTVGVRREAVCLLDQYRPLIPFAPSQHMSSRAAHGLLPPQLPTAQWSCPSGPLHREAWKHRDGMQGAVGTQTPTPHVSCLPVPLNPVSGVEPRSSSMV